MAHKFCWWKLLVLMCFLGCGGEQSTSPQTAKTKSIDSLPRASSNTVAESSKPPSTTQATATPRQQTPASPPLSIDELLLRDDLVEPVKERIRKFKIQGKQTIPSSTLDILISQFDINVAIKERLTQFPSPTQSKFMPSTEAIVYSTQPTTSRKFIDGRLNFWRIGLDHFNQREIPGLSPEGKQLGSAFIKKTLDQWPYRTFKDPWEKLCEEAEEIVAEHPSLKNEPMFQYSLGLASSLSNRFEKAAGMMRVAQQQFAKTDYPARLTTLPCMFINWDADQGMESPSKTRDLADYFVAVDYWLKHDFRAKPEEHRFALEMITDFVNFCVREGEWDVLEQFHDSVVEQTHLPPWIRSMVRANYYQELAGKHRGTGFVNTVSPEDIEKFEEYQVKAADFYQQAFKINPLFPESALAMLKISRTGYSETSEREWFDAAIAGQVDYLIAYEELLWGLYPQWGGSHEKMLEFANEQADKKQYDTIAPYVMMLCYKAIRNETYDTVENKNAILFDPKFVNQVFTALDGMIASDAELVLFESVVDRTYFLTEKAAIAVNTKMYDVARETFVALGDRYHRKALDKLRNSKRTVEVFKAPAFALSGPQKADAEKLLKMTKTPEDFGDSNEESVQAIMDHCTAALKKCDEPETRIFFQRVFDLYDCDLKYLAGKPVQLKFDPAMSTWEFENPSQVHYESPDTVIIDNTTTGLDFALVSNARLQGARMVSVDIELPPADNVNRYGYHLTPAIDLIGCNKYRFSAGLSRNYDVSKKPAHVFDYGQFAFGYSELDRDLMFYTTRFVDGKNNLRVIAKPKYFEVYVNDQFICRSSLEKLSVNGAPFAVRQPKTRKGRGRFKISNIVIQKQSTQAPPIDGPDKDLIEYYQTELKSDPTNKWTAFWLANALHRAGDHAAATKQYQSAIDLGLPESQAAFYLGDCCEALGQTAEAVAWYQKSAQPDQEDVTKLFPRTTTQSYSNSNHWSAYRLAWLFYSSPDQSIREAAKSRSLVPIAEPPAALTWTMDLIMAMDSAYRGKFDQATRLARKALPKCSVDEEETVLAMIKAFESQKPFHEQPTEQPLYRKFEQAIPFFRRIEDELDPNWNRTF